ncbi:hypothetical protein D910_09934 [Dendroctonus ponderosae]
MEVCRLCLLFSESNSYSKLTDPYKCIVNSLIPEVNLDITINPSICHQCSHLVNKLHEFKLACFECQQQRKKQLSKPGCCQTCLKSIEKQFIEDPPDLKSILKFCLPEMDLHFIPDPIVCRKCLVRLQRLQQLKASYLTVEEKLNSFVVDAKRPVDLRKLVHGIPDGKLELLDANTYVDER